MLYERLVFPVARRLDPESAHEQALAALALAQATPAGRLILRRIAGSLPARPVQIGSLRFPNVLGMAAGFDKDARVVGGLAQLGFGHVEVGTLTPRPQSGNPRPRLFRLPDDAAVINRMGFPNGGAEAAAQRLHALTPRPRSYVLGVSLGKQKETPLEEAAADYVSVMHDVFDQADYLAVNISSPNTPGLRALQGGRYLRQMLDELTAANRRLAAERGLELPRPLWVKIAPDLSWAELDEILAELIAAGIDGIIATNTTLSRAGLNSSLRDETGGLSGRPLRAHSTAVIDYIVRHAGSALPVIGVGGVATAADAREKLDAGASLIQLYTSMVYGGPGLAGRILRGLEPLQYA